MTMARITLLTTRESDAWMRVLDDCAPYDFYHLPAYHALAEDAGEGAARLFVYTAGGYTIALPLLLRPIDDCLLSGPEAAGWQDATSVYGYAGPVCSHAAMPEPLVRDFQVALVRQLHEFRIVSVFSRLHPLLPQRPVLAGLGDFTVTATASIDLTLPEEAQRARMRRSHCHRVNKLRRQGVTCLEDREGKYLADFRRVYDETMRRVGAAERYFFPAEYFDRLGRGLGERLRLFVCLAAGEVVCGALFVTCHGIVQYHLSGTLNKALRLAPMTLLIDEVRRWATRRGARVLHLGGGTTPHADDSLLHFKTGFSDRTHEFATWRWVVQPGIYRELCAAKALRDEADGRAGDPRFFPAYRAPAAARAPSECLAVEAAGGRP